MACFSGLIALLAVSSAGQDSDDAYMRALALAGNVQTENGAVADPRLNANTRFEFSVQTHWEYELSVIRRGAQMELVVNPKFQRLEIGVKHKLRLPEGEDVRSDRYRTLLLHEYDHVAISTDMRPRMLLRQLILSIGTIRKPWTGPIPPPEKDVNMLIANEVEERKGTVISTVDLAYRRLDEISDHGRRPIPDRNGFFYPLFNRDFLEKMKFRYFGDAAKIFNSVDYLTAKRYYRS